MNNSYSIKDVIRLLISHIWLIIIITIIGGGAAFGFSKLVLPLEYSSHITMRNIRFDCDRFFDVVQAEDQYHLSDFTFENLHIRAKDTTCNREAVERFKWKNVKVEKVD